MLSCRIESSSFSVSSTLPPTATSHLKRCLSISDVGRNDGEHSPENNYYSIIDTLLSEAGPE